MEEVINETIEPITRMCGGGGCGMSMWFHFGLSETILFKFWKTSTVLGLVLSMLGVFVLTVVYEGLKFYREYLFNKARQTNRVPKMMDQVHIIQTILQVIQFVISYCLMLIFMTYNVWLCLGVTCGVAVGYFIFGWRKSAIDHECCH